MTTDQFISKLKKKLRDLETENRPLKIAALATHQAASDRIFVKGRNTSNDQIGTYSLSPSMYVTPEGYWDFAKLKPPKGKYGNRVFNNGKDHKSRWVAHYSSLRGLIGRDPIKVDFFIHGDFRSDYMNSKGVSGAEPIKVDANFYKVEFSRSKKDITHAELAEVFEAKYGNIKIFTLSKQEIELFYKVAAEEFKKQFEL